MAHSLNAQQRQDYDDNGFISPLPVFPAAEVAHLRAQFEAFEAGLGGKESAAAKRTDLHLIQQWAWDVVTDSRIIDPITSVLGPNVLLWSTNWFIKEARDKKFVSLHQDANYWGLEPHRVATAWIALSDASPATGPMRFIPGSHKHALYTQENTYAENNLLSRGQRVTADIDQNSAILAPLAAGQMSIHHVRVLHSSGANETEDRRIGMVLRYCATEVKQTKGPDTAILVAGQDHYGHFDLLPRPRDDLGRAESARHIDAVQRLQKILLED